MHGNIPVPAITVQCYIPLKIIAVFTVIWVHKKLRLLSRQKYSNNGRKTVLL